MRWSRAPGDRADTTSSHASEACGSSTADQGATLIRTPAAVLADIPDVDTDFLARRAYPDGDRLDRIESIFTYASPRIDFVDWVLNHLPVDLPNGLA